MQPETDEEYEQRRAAERAEVARRSAEREAALPRYVALPQRGLVQASRRGEFDPVRAAGGLIVDRQVTIIGSYNFSAGAAWNSEDLNIVTSPEVAEAKSMEIGRIGIDGGVEMLAERSGGRRADDKTLH